MQRVINLTKVPEALQPLLKDDIERFIQKINKRLKRHHEEAAKLTVLVRPVGGRVERWECHATLGFEHDVLAVRSEIAKEPRAALKEAFDRLMIKIQHHVSKQREFKRKRAKETFRTAMGELSEPLQETLTHDEQENFILLLKPHLDVLRRLIRRELRFMELEGLIDRGSVGVEDVLNEVLLRAWSTYHQRPKEVRVDLWLMRLMLDVLDDVAAQSVRFVPLSEAVQQWFGGEVPEQGFDKDTWWWPLLEPQEDVLWEDLLPDEASLERLHALSEEDERVVVEEGLRILPRRERLAFLLWVAEGYDVEEVAMVLEKSPEQVNDLLLDIRKRILKALVDKADGALQTQSV